MTTMAGTTGQKSDKAKVISVLGDRYAQVEAYAGSYGLKGQLDKIIGLMANNPGSIDPNRPSAAIEEFLTEPVVLEGAIKNRLDAAFQALEATKAEPRQPAAR